MLPIRKSILRPTTRNPSRLGKRTYSLKSIQQMHDTHHQAANHLHNQSRHTNRFKPTATITTNNPHRTNPNNNNPKRPATQSNPAPLNPSRMHYWHRPIQVMPIDSAHRPEPAINPFASFNMRP